MRWLGAVGAALLVVAVVPALAWDAVTDTGETPVPQPQTPVAQAPAPSPDSPAGRFVAWLASDAAASVPADVAKLVRESWAACGDCDADELLTQGLVLISPALRDGLDAYDAEKYDEVITLLTPLTTDANPFVATSAAVFRIKALVALERVAEGLEGVEKLMVDNGAAVARHSYLLAEVEFLRGFCLVMDLQFEAGEAALKQFLTRHPQASQRLVLSAKQMLAELENRKPGGIAEVADLMGFSGRRLESGQSGEDVQQKQERIVSLLDKLIEQAEQQEQNNSGQGQSSGRQSQSGRPSNPMDESKLVPGDPEVGRLNAARRAQPGEMWGAMPPAERERIMQALRESFPSRYRRLVEQYYEELAKKP
jgi:hypothetical protein